MASLVSASRQGDPPLQPQLKNDHLYLRYLYIIVLLDTDTFCFWKVAFYIKFSHATQKSCFIKASFSAVASMLTAGSWDGPAVPIISLNKFYIIISVIAWKVNVTIHIQHVRRFLKIHKMCFWKSSALKVVSEALNDHGSNTLYAPLSCHDKLNCIDFLQITSWFMSLSWHKTVIFQT